MPSRKSSRGLDNFFNAKSVAIIGASRTPGKIGHVIVENFLHGYKGKVYPVNPNADKILGLKSYPSVKKIPADVDMAVITVPAKIVPSVLKECVEKDVEAVIIVSGGFSETGKVGAKMEKELKKIIKDTKTRILGVNCLGVYSPKNGIDTIFNPRERLDRPPAGDIGFISQSGAVGVTILDRLASEDIGISKFISYENATDINEADALDYLGSDRDTKSIVIFIEGVKEGRRFMEAAKRISKKKPIIVLKGGKTPAGTRAAASHTASLAGSSKIYSGMFKQSGIIEANNWEEFFDFTKAFFQPLPKGDNIAIITNGGGFGVLTADACENFGINLPSLPNDIKKKLRDVMPPHAILGNPIDLTGDATTERYQVALEACLNSKKYDGVIAITLFTIPTLEERIVKTLVKMKRYKKPIICCTVGGDYTYRLSKKIESKKIPVYSSPERAAKAMSILMDYMKYLKNH